MLTNKGAAKRMTIVTKKQNVPCFWNILCHIYGNATKADRCAVKYFLCRRANLFYFFYYFQLLIMANGVVLDLVRLDCAPVIWHYRNVYGVSIVQENVLFVQHRH